MSLQLEMVQAARVAPKVLGEASDMVRRFLVGQQHEGGGFKDRAGREDLYYTVFGVAGAIALQQEMHWPAAVEYVNRFRETPPSDFVHRCCLVRTIALLKSVQPSLVPKDWAGWAVETCESLEDYRTGDGGYHPIRGQVAGTAYGCFLALGAYEDGGRDMPSRGGILDCLSQLTTPDGAWANDRGLELGSTNATAAVCRVLRHLERRVPSSAVAWLLARHHAQGGFLAAPESPMPDLLSTATALHALAGEEVSLEDLREPCLDFLDSLWTNAGAFHGHWADDMLDVEYTFYGLLALGHLGG